MVALWSQKTAISYLRMRNKDVLKCITYWIVAIYDLFYLEIFVDAILLLLILCLLVVLLEKFFFIKIIF
jgi:hypothetical protein